MWSSRDHSVWHPETHLEVNVQQLLHQQVNSPCSCLVFRIRWPQSVRLHDTQKPNYWVSPTMIWFFKMHVYTLVWLKSDQIGFLIFGLKHLNYSIDSRITPACIRSIRSDSDFAFCAGSRFFFRGHEPEVEGRRQQSLSSKITASKSAIVHLVCVIIMYTIYEMYKDVASPRSSYAIFVECQGRVYCSWWRKEVSRRWLYYH